MSEKYPYLNSVIFSNKTRVQQEVEDENKRELSINYSCSSSDLNVDDQFQDIDLNCSKNGGLNFQDILSWQVEPESSEIIPDVINGGTLNARELMCTSSVSSLSSLTSTNDVTSVSHSHSTERQNHSQGFNRYSGMNSKPVIPIATQSAPLTILSHISKFIQGKQKPATKPQTTPLKSTTCLILNDRPSGLPVKSPEELRRHTEAYNQLLNAIKKKEQNQIHREKAKEKTKINLEERQIQLANIWKDFIIPNWSHQKSSKFVRHLWWEGIPTSLRDKVWKLCIPNMLRLTKVHYENFLSQMQERIERYREMQKNESISANACTTVNNDVVTYRLRTEGTSQNPESRSSAYDIYISETVSIHSQRSSAHSSSFSRKISNHRGSVTSSSETEMRQTLLNTIKLDVARTFPHLNLFQNGGPHYDLLYQLLGSYTCYRPDIGYVQGMSFLAAILILVMNVDDAFISFANIIEMPCHHALYGLDENEFTVYVESFKLLLLSHLPQLGQHFVRNRLDVNIFLCDWLFTIYSRALPLETALIVWDMFCRDGETALFRAGLGILRCYEMQLLNSDFEELASFLTGQMPESLTPPLLVEEMREIRLSQSKFAASLEEVRSRLASRGAT